MAFDEVFPRLLEEYGVVTAGVGIIKNGELVWAGYYGEQSPDVPASASTQFDVASITKMVTTETILRLVDAGSLSLDESMATHWVDPDLDDDPRHDLITPRMVLSHSSGLPNWRFLRHTDGFYDPDMPLTILFQPGSSYNYSGEGFEYVARFAERKVGRDFEELVQEQVFAPLGMNGVSFSAREANFGNIVRAEDEDGVFHGHYCRPSGNCRDEGEWSAADDMRVTITDYAKFLIGVMNGVGYRDEIAEDRSRVQVEKWNVPESILVLCDHVPAEACPQRQGYGLGWEVADYGDYKILSHGGNDWSEAAIAYFYTDTKEGIMVFLNAPSSRANAMMPMQLD